jgi:hypothetical protein
MKPILLLAVVSLCVAASAQEPKTGLTRSTPKKVAADTAPVSRAEAKRVLQRAEKVLVEALGVSKGAASKLGSGSKPITREETVTEFRRLYDMVQPAVKLTPRPVRFTESRLKMTGSARKDLAMLVRMGAVAPYGPVSTGPKSTLSVAEFGDALGFFLARVSEITHMPSRRWTPSLQDG